MGRFSSLYKYLPLLECTGIVIFVAILVLPDFWMYGGTDYGGAFNNGRLIANGQSPYTDFWSHKNPLYFYYLGIWQLIFGSSWWSAKAALVPTYGLFAISIYIFCAAVFQRRWLPLTAALAGVYLVLRPSWDTTHNGSLLIFATSLELFALAFLFRGLLVTQRIPRFFLMAGGLAACAFLTRQTAIVPFIIAAGAPFFIINKNRCLTLFKEITHILVPLLAGAAAIIIAFFALILIKSDIGEWYSQTIVFNVKFVTVAAGDGGVITWVIDQLQTLSRNQLMWIMALGGIAFYPGFRAASLSQQETAQLVRLKFAYSCLFVSLLCVIATLNTTANYTIQYLPYLLILSLVAIVNYAQLVLHTLTTRAKPVVVSIFILMLILAWGWQTGLGDALSLRSWYLTASHYHFDPNRMPDQIVAREIDSLCDQDDTIYVHVGRPWVYLLSNKESPNIYYFSSGLFWKGYKTPEEFQTEMSRLDKAPPKVVIYWGVRLGPNPHPRFFEDEYIKQFNQFVLSKYSLHKVVPLDQTWPYSGYEGPVYIFVLNP